MRQLWGTPKIGLNWFTALFPQAPDLALRAPLPTKLSSSSPKSHLLTVSTAFATVGTGELPTLADMSCGLLPSFLASLFFMERGRGEIGKTKLVNRDELLHPLLRWRKKEKEEKDVGQGRWRQKNKNEKKKEKTPNTTAENKANSYLYAQILHHGVHSAPGKKFTLTYLQGIHPIFLPNATQKSYSSFVSFFFRWPMSKKREVIYLGCYWYNQFDEVFGNGTQDFSRVVNLIFPIRWKASERNKRKKVITSASWSFFATMSALIFRHIPK